MVVYRRATQFTASTLHLGCEIGQQGATVQDVQVQELKTPAASHPICLDQSARFTFHDFGDIGAATSVYGDLPGSHHPVQCCACRHLTTLRQPKVYSAQADRCGGQNAPALIWRGR
jgi:hypothetical protein